MPTVYKVYEGKLVGAEATETNKLYKFSKPIDFSYRAAWSYRSQINKSEAFLTPDEAIENALHESNEQILELHELLSLRKIERQQIINLKENLK